jgi:group I intron endonuclease
MIFADWRGFKVLERNIPEYRPGIYCIQNMLNEKKYVGISQNVATRLLDYTSPERSSIGPIIRSALLKYKVSSFLLLPLYYQDDYNREILLEMERAYIKLFDSVRNGYNVLESSKGGPRYGLLFQTICKQIHSTPESRARKSTRIRETWSDPQYRKVRGSKNAIVWERPEIKAARKASLMRIASSAEIKLKRSLHQSVTLKANPYNLITNGINNRKLLKTEQLPDGWHYGLTHRIKPSGRPRRALT